MKYKTLFLFCLLTLKSIGQLPPIIECKVLNSASTNFNAVNTHCQFTFNDYRNVPEITLNVNFHVLPNRFASNAEAVLAVRRLLSNVNIVLENMAQYDQPGPNGMVVPLVQKAKFKLKLYSEPTNTADLFGGIWLYNDDNLINRYAGRALNISLESRIRADGTHICGFEGESFIGTGINSTVFVRDFFCNRNSSIEFFPTTLAHEIGHKLGLNHPTWCMNECAGIDIDPQVECKPRCPAPHLIGGGLCNPNQANNGGPLVCNPLPGDTDSTILCNVCDMSNNLTGSCFRYPKAITPCQWTTMFNDVLHGGSQYALLCFTAANFILPTSPLNDYRASQTITSASVIAGDRIVDYWSPTITLNAGFQVNLGTTFLASPTTFPCCLQGGVGGGAEQTIVEKENISSLPQSFKVVPNPFGDYIQINYQIENDLDKVSLTMTDISGKIVKKIPINTKSEGQYQIEVKTNDLSNGIYFIQYQSNGNTSTQKIVKTNKN